MHTENYQKAIDDLTFAQGAMQEQLKRATTYEGICLLQVLKQLAETKAMLVNLCDAATHEDSLLYLSA